MRKKNVVATIALLSPILIAGQALAVPGLSSPSSVNEITRMLKAYTGSNAPNIYQIEQQLRDKPNEACEALINILDTSDTQLKLHAAQLLQRMSNGNGEIGISANALKTLVGFTRAADSPQVQAALLETLGNIGPKNDDVKKTIIDCLKNSRESSVRRASVDALSRLAHEEKPALHTISTAALIEVLKKDDSPAVRAQAAGALGNYRDNPTVAIPALTAALSDNYLQVRTRAVQSLGQYGKAASPALPKIVEALQTETDQSLQHTCLYSLRNIDTSDPLVVKELIRLLDDPNLSDNVFGYMYDIGPAGAPAVPKLIARLATCKRHQLPNIIRTLGSIGPKAKDALPALNAMIPEADTNTRRQISEAIRGIDPTGTIDGAQTSTGELIRD